MGPAHRLDDWADTRSDPARFTHQDHVGLRQAADETQALNGHSPIRMMERVAGREGSEQEEQGDAEEAEMLALYD